MASPRKLQFAHSDEKRPKLALPPPRRRHARCIIYIVRRTQLYLDDEAWSLLHALARHSGSTVSELVRQAVREKYYDKGKGRKEAFEAVVGLWKDRTDLPDTETYVRSLRKSKRWDRLKF